MKEDEVEAISKKILDLVRDTAADLELKQKRLPRWMEAGSIVGANPHDTYCVSIEHRVGESDTFEFRTDVSETTELFLDFKVNDPQYAGAKWKEQYPPDPEIETIVFPREMAADLPMHEEGDDVGMRLRSKNSVLFELPSLKYHNPIVVENLYLQTLSESGHWSRTKYIPLAIFIHEYDMYNRPSEVVESVATEILRTLKTIHDSTEGDYYAKKRNRSESLTTSVNDSVIVLGAYDDGKFERELENVRDQLQLDDYQASLIKDLEGHPARSITHKVKMYSLSSRFCVMVDREASGHLVEYSELMDEEIPIALLRKQGSGSTRMIGHERVTNDFVELFEFEESPIECLPDVYDWVDDFLNQLEREYKNEFPWRKSQ